MINIEIGNSSQTLAPPQKGVFPHLTLFYIIYGKFVSHENYLPNLELGLGFIQLYRIIHAVLHDYLHL